MAKFAAVVEFDPAIEEARLAVRPSHREYLGRLQSEGRLYSSGPWMDDTGALLIYEAADEDEVRAIMADDPYTPTGAFSRVRIKEWKQVFPPLV
ncbi:MAG: hypothetical protein AVDCRST_MAG49-3619 [uncultured Thermomicrobiales bacterium]|uniref:YCII-related domain-containing protein n=1 Tax=uncultured Thermomicrobiales bacterium TaxID=1645740 RepID=A0A6J4VBP0_9BACT|nr:MAG: hypothetical protein AVDCRST_MAG49-3619 [uncultured Thermomicrobiales bacterium]